MPREMKPQYVPQTFDEALGYLVEECGEVLAAAGKTIRWGPDSYNPEIPEGERESNGDWIARELVDLSRAITIMRDHLERCGFAGGESDAPTE